ncbi:MAG: MmgE/PrpD family protein [Alphaproteobacteria bacterium]|nr:MmgE/PrpD family protein [Alphaproteobacteria bacterium]
MSSIDHLIALAVMPAKSILATARRYATLSLFDWIMCGRAGAEQDLSKIIRKYILEDAGRKSATVFGSKSKVPSRSAALVNGTISHALDYDDTHFAHIGHTSVGIYPAALAVGEEVKAKASAIRDAYLLGAEAACRIGMVLGRGHYQKGFHQTATAGAFGATVAAGWLYRLNEKQMRAALSLVATRASGLKSQFGTMGKPFNAGISASNGVEAAALAKRGFTSADDGVGGPQGFVETHAYTFDHITPWQDPPPRKFIFEDVQYKLHACCHGTHAMIEALKKANVSGSDVENITVTTHPRWLKVCDIKEPRTGLEVKFSYVHLAAMVAYGIDTSSEKIFTYALARDKKLINLAKRVKVTTDERYNDTTQSVVIKLKSGRSESIRHDLADRVPMLELEAGLRNKAKALLGKAQAEKLWLGVAEIEKLSAANLAKLLHTSQSKSKLKSKSKVE